MTKRAAATIILLLMSIIANAAETSRREIPFIHFNENYCTECHVQIPANGKETFLRFDDYDRTCRCHGYTAETYTHPVAIAPAAEMKMKMGTVLPLDDGKITCNTCHAISRQCTAAAPSPPNNKGFLRIYYPASRTALCYTCHEESDYKRLNPHEQLDAAGNIIEAKCLYCHKMKPDEKHATLKKQRQGYPGTVEFVAKLSTLCFRCHFRQTKQHIVTTYHLRKPPPDIRARMQYSEELLWVILPLDDSGSITCATCHNPHQRGVIPAMSPGARGASEYRRLRVTLDKNRICKACHDK
jgi:hypothetical protein